jgi:HAD superfamily hydrolase (TIGR01549 family)
MRRKRSPRGTGGPGQQPGLRPDREWSGSPPPPRGRFGPWSDLVRGLALTILDLFEDLAHPRPHELALLGRGFPVSPADPFRLARIEIVGRFHPPIVRDADEPVNPSRRTLARHPCATACDPSRMQALIFDLDGTLVDTVYAHVFAWQRALLELGIPVDGWRIHRRIGMSGGLFTRAVAREIGRDLTNDEADTLQRRHGEVFREILPERRTLPGAIELLDDLRRAGVPHGIATSGRRPEIDRSLEALGIPPETVVVERGDVLRAKPEPDLFLACQERLGVAVRDCYVVGDAVWDLLAARRAGMLSVGLLTGGYGEDELRAAGAFRVYRDAEELHESLDELGIAPEPA